MPDWEGDKGSCPGFFAPGSINLAQAVVALNPRIERQISDLRPGKAIVTITNGVGTTLGQVARGARNTDDWFLGFSISRKFY